MTRWKTRLTTHGDFAILFVSTTTGDFMNEPMEQIDREVFEGFELLDLLDQYDKEFTTPEDYAIRNFEICTRYSRSDLVTSSSSGV
jgi:hypothetical protein